MKPSTKDQVAGKLHEMKGKVKQTVGQATNNPNLAAEGQDRNDKQHDDKQHGEGCQKRIAPSFPQEMVVHSGAPFTV